MRLSRKIALSILVAAAVTVAVLGFFVFTRTSAALQAAISKNQLEGTRQTIDKIDRLLYERYLDISSIAENRTLKLFMAASSNARINEELSADLQQEFRNQTVLTGPWDLLLAADQNGTILVSTKAITVGERIGTNPHHQKAFNQAMEGRIYYSDFLLSPDSEKPTILFAAPIRSEESGRPILGVVVGNFTWAVVLEVLEEHAAQAHLYNSKGLLIGSSNPDRNRENLFQDDSTNLAVRHALEQREGSGVFPDSITGDFAVLASHARQLGYLNYKGSDWRLVLETPAAVAFAPARREAAELALVAAAGSLLAALGIFLLLNRSVLQPIGSLTQTASIIAQGDLEQRAHMRSKDELGKLAESFNRMADRLIEARKLPEEIIHSLRDGLITLNRHGRIEVINPQAETTLEVKKGSAIGKLLEGPLSELLHKEKDEFFRKELLFPRGITVEVTRVPLEKKKAMLVLHDITREKRIELMKSEFVSVVAHQLRTPLSALKWSIALLNESNKKLTKNQRELVDKMNISNERMIRLVNDLLDAARVEEGRFVYKRGLADLVSLVESVMSQEQEKSQQKKVKLTFQKPAPSSLPLVSVDEKAITLALQNLIENSVRYTPSGGKIRIAIEQQPEQNNLVVSVSDTGIGITKKEGERIFTKFFRGANAVKMETDGTGLGLFITKNIIEAHGGTIWFESKEGKGSAFFFTLPLQ